MIHTPSTGGSPGDIGCAWACARRSDVVITTSPFNVRSALARGTIVFFCGAAAAVAQAPTSGKDQTAKSTAPPPIARFVPAAAKLFVVFTRPGEADEAMRQAHIGYLWSMAADKKANPEKPADLRSALTQFLGPDSSINTDELMRTEIGLMASSWSDLGDAVWFVRLPKSSPLERWFPKDRRQETPGPSADSLFRMNDGMIVGVRDGIMAMSRGGDDAALVRVVFRMMVGGAAKTLHDSPTYRELIAYLPDKILAAAYWARASREPAQVSKVSLFLPPISHAVVGMSASGRGIDFAVRAAISPPISRKTLAGHAVDRLMKLPATTLVACATTIDFDSSFQPTVGTGPLDGWAKALSFVKSFWSADGEPAPPLPPLGPHVLLAWDQDLDNAGSSPQLALLLETKNARQLEGQFEALVENLIGHDEVIESAPASESEPIITRGTHFGVSIAEATLYPDIEESLLPLLPLFEELPLSWAAHGEWFIVARSRDHIERILDAQFGLLPALSNVRDVQALRKRRASHTSIFLLQPDLAADVLKQWIAAETTPTTKLDPSLLSDPRLAEAVQRKRLGIGMQLESEPGTVVVARVYPGTAADGHLFPDDRIIGLDGRLLDLKSPNADLRRRWADPSAAHGHTFRVQREDTTIEVFLKHDEPDVQKEDLFVRALPAVQGLASVLSTVRFASLTVHPTDERHFSALVSLRIVPPPTSARR